jgi:hypothetical protein
MFSLALAACSVSAPMPLAASGPAQVRLGGLAFMADLQPVERGAQIHIAGQAQPLALDEGRLAKSVAQQFCRDRSQALDPQALGAYLGGTWVFDGGCL